METDLATTDNIMEIRRATLDSIERYAKFLVNSHGINRLTAKNFAIDYYNSMLYSFVINPGRRTRPINIKRAMVANEPIIDYGKQISEVQEAARIDASKYINIKSGRVRAGLPIPNPPYIGFVE